jgi:hypothetical protein
LESSSCVTATVLADAVCEGLVGAAAGAPPALLQAVASVATAAAAHTSSAVAVYLMDIAQALRLRLLAALPAAPDAPTG